MNNAALIGAVTLMVLAAILWPKGRSNRTPNVSTMAKISRARSPSSQLPQSCNAFQSKPDI
jgi:hypothetical protein